MKETRLVLECVSNHWMLEIGDPGLLGWGTVLAYLAASVLAFRVYRGAPGLYPATHAPRQKLFWLIMACGLVLLAVNKQLDLQSLFILTGKCMSLAEGWYDSKQLVRNIFTISLTLVAAVGLVILGWFLRRVWKTNLVALSGIALILLFIVLRAATFMHFGGDDWSPLFESRYHWILELGGIFLIILAAWRHLTLRPADRAKNTAQ